MKFRHVFLIFGAMLVLVFAGTGIRSIVNELRKLPVYEVEMISDPFTLLVVVDGVEYHNAGKTLVPLKVDHSPFGVTREKSDDYLYWADEPGGEWIYNDSKVMRKYLKRGGFVYRRGDLDKPTLEDASICRVSVSSIPYPSPLKEQLLTAPLLQGCAASQDFAEYLQENKTFSLNTLLLSNAELIGSLWIECLEYPRIAFMFQIYRDDKKIIMYDSVSTFITLNEEYSALVLENLPPSPRNRSLLTRPTDPYQALPLYEEMMDRDGPSGIYLLVDDVKYYGVSGNFVPLATEKEPFGRLGVNRSLYWVDEPNGEFLCGTDATTTYVYRREDVEIPSLEDVSVNHVGVMGESYSTPSIEVWNTAPLLQGYGAAQDFAAFLQESEIQIFSELRYNSEPIGSLQLRCLEYPRMAFVYQIYRDEDDGQIVLMEHFVIGYQCNGYYSDLIKKGLTK